MKPKPNEVYRRKGFYFRVNYVERGSVYVYKRKGDREEYIRVTSRTWQEQMAGAKPLGKREAR